MRGPPLLLLTLLLACTACGGGRAGSESQTTAIRTLAYVLTECHEQMGSAAAISQSLQIVRGDAPPVTVFPLGPIEISGLPGVCRLLASGRFGPSFVSQGVFERLGVSPDGSVVVFEVSAEFTNPSLGISLPPGSEGIFTVRSDGTGLRRLGDASREASFRAMSSVIITFLGINYGFSPDSRTVAFTDLGPGPLGEEAIQVFTLELATGMRTQVTHLPVSVPPSGTPATSFPSFLDASHIAFFTTANPDGLNPDNAFIGFTLNPDGSLSPGTLPVALPGSQLVPSFAISGPQPSAVILPVPCAAPACEPGQPVQISQWSKSSCSTAIGLLQLTKFERTDITAAIVSANPDEVFFNASADPFGENPTENCQLFSIDRTGGDLRQLTHFREGVHSSVGCYYDDPPRGCAIGFLWQDPITKTLVFYSSCDPLGAGFNGAQIFAMRPDGTGLRQLTHTSGFVSHGDSVMMELPGPLAYSSLVRSLR